MPIPNPKPNEKKNDFISRCFSKIKDEYPKDQALAICYSRWEAMKESIVKRFLNEEDFGIDEMLEFFHELYENKPE